MKIIKGGITAPVGFLANGISCGIKKGNKKDLALLYSTVKAKAVAAFTSNQIQAAPIKVSKSNIKNNAAQAVIINSGNANCFTGNIGIEYSRKTTELVARSLGIDKADVLVASTGIIARPLPFTKIKNALPSLILGLDKNKSHDASLAILTTDKYTKEIACEINIKGKKVKIGAMAKGAGMIYPDFDHATMLAFVTTDVDMELGLIKTAFKEAVKQSFECISIDGCQSTNDFVVMLANGLSFNKRISAREKDFIKFKDALDFVCQYLAKSIIKDAEGATKFIKINCTGARKEKEAKKIAFSIANSALFKTAITGENRNVGRVIAAAGACGIKLREDDLTMNMSDLKKKEINVEVNLNMGKASACVFTCDLSKEYVDINAGYS